MTSLTQCLAKYGVRAGTDVDDQDNLELIQLPAGSLYLVRPGGLQGARECLCPDAQATIRRTTVPRNYQLVISHAKSAPGALPDVQQDGASDEHAFLVDEALQFRAGEHDGAPSFVWRNMQGDEDDTYEFVVDPAHVNAVMRSVFEVTYLQCAWERKTGRSHEEATDEDLEALKYRGAGTPAAAPTSTAPEAPAADPTPGAPAAPAAPATTAARAQAARPKAESLQTVTGSAEPTIVLTARADLYLYDPQSGLFMRQEKNVTVQAAEAGRFLCMHND